MVTSPKRLRWQGPAAYTEDRPVLSSRKQDRNCERVLISGHERHEAQMWLDTKTY
jgi:hypothetical protein